MHPEPLTRPLDLSRLKVTALAERRSLSRIDEILVEPSTAPPPCPSRMLYEIGECAAGIREARKRGAGVLVIYGAHLIKNGGQLLLNQMVERRWITHLATNGAGSIHDWEFAWLGRSTESVRDNVATGTFGTWDETGRYVHLALLAGGLKGDGYGRALGRFIQEEGTTLPSTEALMELVRCAPDDPLTPARAELLQVMVRNGLRAGPHVVPHRYGSSSVLAGAFRHEVPLTVHPGIGYDIISNHPLFNGSAIGRAAAVDFQWFAGAVERLDHGVVLCIGSAIMGPQVFEKSLSCVNNLRLQEGRPIVQEHDIYVVDLQDAGGWDWTKGEPPKESPAYYLRFCKSFARMGGRMHYLQCDNVTFLHHLFRQLTDEVQRPTA
jgi:hypothetical protein